MTDAMVRIKAAEKRARSRLRAGLSRVLAMLAGPRDAPTPTMDASAVRQVLVVRMNGRMGNTLFLTPLLGAIHEVMPLAAIDVMVNYPDAADLLRGLPGVRNVLTIPHRGWWRLGRTFATLKAYRAQRYDVAIDPAANSFSARIMLMFAHARWRLGFGGAEQWARIDFAATRSPDLTHDALQPLALLQQAFGYPVRPGQDLLRVANSDAELAAGARLLEESLRRGRRTRSDGAPVIGFFASARGRKDLGPEWWREFWREYLRLRPATVPLEVLPTMNHPPIDASFAAVHCRSPRALAATVAHVDWFFSADTGPMHLASASGAPTVAFFDRTRVAKFGPIKPNDVALNIAGMTPQAVAAACAQIVTAAPGR